MQGMALVFFIVFGFVIAGMYLGIRRRLAPTRTIAIGGTLASIVTMSLSMMSRPNVSPVQGILMGLVVGTIMGLATLAVAIYFQRNEARGELANNKNG